MLIHVNRFPIIFCCLLVTGFAVNRFNWNNIRCERYFSQALGAEQRGVNMLALSAGLRAHACVEERMDVLITVGRAYAATCFCFPAISVVERLNIADWKSRTKFTAPNTTLYWVFMDAM